MIKVLADAHIPWLGHLLKGTARLSYFHSTTELHDLLSGNDALLIRTVAPINPTVFPEFPSSLKFIGSATAGTDHVDVDWVEKNSIRFASSPGCNAPSVAEYVVTSMLLAIGDIAGLKRCRVGIIGFGHTGKAVAGMLDRIGVKWLAYDPPLEEMRTGFTGTDFADVLGCDIITLHVPLTVSGRWPTFRMIGEKELKGRKYRMFINAARGDVSDEAALIQAKLTGNIDHLIVDTWANEPDINLKLMSVATLATPHIAGYSQESKYEASRMVCEEMADFFGISVNDNVPEVFEETEIPANDGIISLLKEIHPATQLDSLLRKNPKGFAGLRNTFPLRTEFPNFSLLNLPGADRELAESLGFKP